MAASFFCPPKEGTVSLGVSDLYLTTFAKIPWTMFYRYDIPGAKLKSALDKVASKYPVLGGRLVADADTRLSVTLKPDAGFVMTEETSELSLVEAVSKARVDVQPAAFPSFAQLPFFMADMNTLATIDQDGPLFSLKLTHYKDGTCSLGATIHHAVADAQRLGDIVAVISAAFRGEEIGDACHDRTLLWPDKLLEKVELGLSPADFPRKVPNTVDNLELGSFPDDTYAVESLFFPKEALEQLKAKIAAKLPGDVEYVSQIDVVTAVIWMLRCELNAVRDGGAGGSIATAADLSILDSFFLIFIDIVANDDTLLPKNYFGNAMFGTLVHYAAEESAGGKDLLDTAVGLACAVRKHVLTMRSPQALAMNVAGVYKAMHEMPPYPPIVGGASSFFRMPFDKMDFGNGAPVFNYGLPAYPFLHIWGCYCPVPTDAGVLVNTVVRTSDRQNTLDSAVFKELIPEVKMLSNETPQSLAKLLALDKVEA